jgi:hypothetical protein
VLHNDVHALVLNALNFRAADFAGKEAVLRVIFEVAAGIGRAVDVRARAVQADDVGPQAVVADYIAEQREFEKQGKFDLDAAADPTAKALGKIFMCFGGDSASGRVLRRLGYCMGRYIYIIDAVSDFESDLKNGSYNPFCGCTKQEMIDLARQAVNLSAAEAQRAFELLDICKFKDILGNIIYLGLEETSKEVFKKVNKENNK